MLSDLTPKPSMRESHYEQIYRSKQYRLQLDNDGPSHLLPSVCHRLILLGHLSPSRLLPSVFIGRFGLDIRLGQGNIVHKVYERLCQFKPLLVINVKRTLVVAQYFLAQ